MEAATNDNKTIQTRIMEAAADKVTIELYGRMATMKDEELFITHGIDGDMVITHVDQEGNGLSARGMEWLMYAAAVLNHIESYTVPQYGDKGSDQATDWSVEFCLENEKKYVNRYGKNQRPGQEFLDLKKAGHYNCIAYNKLMDAQAQEGFDSAANPT